MNMNNVREIKISYNQNLDKFFIYVENKDYSGDTFNCEDVIIEDSVIDVIKHKEYDREKDEYESDAYDIARDSKHSGFSKYNTNYKGD